jgi:hypothetical protein
MDPYAETRALWKGLHTQLIGELAIRQLPPLLAPAYFVDAEPSLQVRADRGIYSDIQIVGRKRLAEVRPAGLGMAVAEPTAIVIATPDEDEESEESAIFIREAGADSGRPLAAH